MTLINNKKTTDQVVHIEEEGNFKEIKDYDKAPPAAAVSMTINSATTTDVTNAPPVTSTKRPRVYYIDKLRTWLTYLVIIHHCFWAVAAGWLPFYGPWQVDGPTLVLSYMILSGDQAYFMGLFFFLSGIVTAPSLKRKGPWLFLKDRFIRLVIPAIFYDMVLFPLLYCFVEVTWYGPMRGSTASMGDVWTYYFNNYHFLSNQMWFTMTLFFFNLVAVILFEVFKSWKDFAFSTTSLNPMSQRDILLLLVKLSTLLFVLNYILRAITAKDGYVWIPVLGNLGFLMQYIVAFTAGILTNSFQFLDQIKKEHIPVVFVISMVLYFAFQTCQTYVIDALVAGTGFYVSTLIITFFEQFYAVFFSYLTLAVFKEYMNAAPSPFFAKVIGAAYATYIIHQWIVIPLAVGFAYTNIYPLGVIAILCVVTPVISWAAGLLLKAIPGADYIL